jgi:hypothetical protein
VQLPAQKIAVETVILLDQLLVFLVLDRIRVIEQNEQPNQIDDYAVAANNVVNVVAESENVELLKITQKYVPYEVGFLARIIQFVKDLARDGAGAS